MALAKFKYVVSKDRGVNPDKSKTLYGIVFPAGKAVEVPDDIAHKLRTKAGREGDEFEEVSSGSAEKSEAEVNREKEIKAEEKAAKKEKPPTEEELEELRKLAAAEEARVAKIQADAKAGR